MKYKDQKLREELESYFLDFVNTYYQENKIIDDTVLGKIEKLDKKQLELKYQESILLNVAFYEAIKRLCEFVGMVEGDDETDYKDFIQGLVAMPEKFFIEYVDDMKKQRESFAKQIKINDFVKELFQKGEPND